LKNLLNETEVSESERAAAVAAEDAED